MKKLIRPILIAIVLLIGIFIIGWLWFLNAPKATVDNKQADITITAEALFQEYSQDEKIGDQKFISKIIEVKGIVADQYEDEQGAAVVLLGLEGGELGGVLCTFTLDQKESVQHLKKGDSISVKGSCSGMLMEVVLNRCTLVE